MRFYTPGQVSTPTPSAYRGYYSLSDCLPLLAMRQCSVLYIGGCIHVWGAFAVTCVPQQAMNSRYVRSLMDHDTQVHNQSTTVECCAGDDHPHPTSSTKGLSCSIIVPIQHLSGIYPLPAMRNTNRSSLYTLDRSYMKMNQLLRLLGSISKTSCSLPGTPLPTMILGNTRCLLKSCRLHEALARTSGSVLSVSTNSLITVT